MGQGDKRKEDDKDKEKDSWRSKIGLGRKDRRSGKPDEQESSTAPGTDTVRSGTEIGVPELRDATDQHPIGIYQSSLPPQNEVRNQIPHVHEGQHRDGGYAGGGDDAESEAWSMSGHLKRYPAFVYDESGLKYPNQKYAPTDDLDTLDSSRPQSTQIQNVRRDPADQPRTGAVEPGLHQRPEDRNEDRNEDFERQLKQQTNVNVGLRNTINWQAAEINNLRTEQSKWSETVKLLESDNEVHVVSLEKQRKETAKLREQHQTKIRDLQSEHSDEQGELRRQLEQQQEKHNEELDDLRNRHAVECHEQDGRYKTELQALERRLEREHQASVENLQLEHRAAERALQQEISTLKADIQYAANAHEASLQQHSQELKNREDKLAAQHQRNTNRLRDQVDELNTALVTQDVELYSASLFATSGLPQRPDAKIKQSFLEIEVLVEDLGRLTWSQHRRLLPDDELQRLSGSPALRELKKAIVQDLVWCILYRYVFASPFRMFDKQGLKLEDEWVKQCGQEPALDRSSYVWPLPSAQTERWRYVTLDACRETLTAKFTEWVPRAELKKGYSETVIKLACELKARIADIIDLTPDTSERIERLAKRAPKMWLEFGMHRCRLEVCLTGSVSIDLLERLTEILEGSITLTVSPTLARHGNSKGADLDVYKIISEGDVYSLEIQ